MRVTVLLFAALAQAHGTRELALDLPPGTAAGAVWDQLRRGHPEWGEIGQAVILAVNGEFQPPGRILREGDTVALLPPMSGGAPPPCAASLVHGPLPPAPAWADTAIGAIVRFEGVTRGSTPAAPGRAVVRLEYEAYESMAARRLQAIAAEALERWRLRGIEIVHRLGTVALGEVSVRVTVAASHRDSAFAACRFAIDTLKHSAPIWKCEIFADGSRWADGELPPVSAPAAPTADNSGPPGD